MGQARSRHTSHRESEALLFWSLARRIRLSPIFEDSAEAFSELMDLEERTTWPRLLDRCDEIL